MQDQTRMAGAPTTAETRGKGRRRGVLSGLALILACLAIVLTTTAVWVHQVALNTDRFTGLVTDVVADPAVIDPVAARISEQIITALDVEARIAEQLPGPSQRLASSLTAAIQGAVERRLQQALANPKIQSVLLKSLSFTHARVVKFLRGDSEAITIVDGYVQLNALSVVGAALAEVQAIGLIPADVQLPDLTADEAPAALSGQLASTLAITLPPDFGTTQLMKAEKLAAAQAAVQAFDLLVVGLILLSVVLVALALWLAGDRRRMVIYLGLGTIIALLVARFVIQGLTSAVVDGIAEQGIAGALLAVVDAAVQDLVNLTTIVLIVTAVLCVGAYVAGRPAWLVRLTSGSSTATEPGAGSPGET